MTDVAGSFYTGRKIRQGVSASSPSNETGVTPEPLNPPGSIGVNLFTSLSDTPSTYVGQANKWPRVNPGATALIFDTVSPFDLDQEGASDGQALVWSTANSRYQPETVGGGGGSKWSDGSVYGIWRNSQVGIGVDPTIETTALYVKSMVVAGNGGGGTFDKPLVFNLEGENGQWLFRVNDGTNAQGFRWQTEIWSHILNVGNPATNFASNGTTIKGTSTSDTGQILRVLNNSDSVAFEVGGGGAIYSSGIGSVIGGNLSTPNKATRGQTIKGNTAASTLSIFRVLPFNNSPIIDVRGNGDLYFDGLFIFNENKNLSFGTATGTRIGVLTSQKLAFWNKTPIIQPTNAIVGAARVGGGGTTITDTDTFGGYTIAQLAAVLINTGLTS